MNIKGCVQRIVNAFYYRSIARTAKVSQEELVEAAKTTTIEVEHPKEWKLAKLLLKLPEVIISFSILFQYEARCLCKKSLDPSVCNITV